MENFERDKRKEFTLNAFLVVVAVKMDFNLVYLRIFKFDLMSNKA
jgi:hypothetical protein